MSLRSARAGMDLSPRELDVLRLIAEGCSNQRIGERLGISGHTVNTHAKRILRKLGANNRAHAVALSFRRAIIT